MTLPVTRPFRNALSLLLISLLICLSMIGCGSSPDSEGSIVLEASTTSLPADGSSSAIIQATVIGTDGEPAPVGSEVRFTTTLGRFGDGSRSYGVVVESEDGTVTVALIAGYETGTATVTAECNNVTQSTYIQIGLTGGSITLTADPTYLPNDGVSASTITATVKNGTGDAVPTGTLVNFTTTLGTFSNGAQSITLYTSDNTGAATVSLIAGTTAGTATVTATSSGLSQKVQVYIGAASDTITLSTDPLNGEIPADGISTMIITALVNDADGTPITIGSPVTFSTTDGEFAENGGKTITTPAVEISDTRNGAIVTLVASETDHKVTVTCTALGHSKSIQVTFTDPEDEDAANDEDNGTDTASLNSTAQASLLITADQATIPADGRSYMTVRAEVATDTEEVASLGTQVTFSTTLGSFTNGSQEIQTVVTDAQGGAETLLYADTVPGLCVVSGEALDARASLYVTFTR